MAVVKIIHRPDTCDCVLVRTFDRDTLEEVHEHTDRDVIRHGAEHAATRWQDLFTAVPVENRRKNRALTIMQEERPGLDMRRVTWTFDEDRVLTVDAGGQLSAAQKTLTQGRYDVAFSPGRAVAR